MARTIKDFAISTPTARGRLKRAASPYYRSVQQGLALGYRRGRKGGTWVARMRLPEQSSYGETKLGAADDGGAVADGAAVLSYDSAVKAAREAFAAAEARRVSRNPAERREGHNRRRPRSLPQGLPRRRHEARQGTRPRHRQRRLDLQMPPASAARQHPA